MTEIGELLQQRIQNNDILDSTKIVTEELNREHGREFQQAMVHKVMKHRLGMRWKKIVTLSFWENSIANLILR